MKSWQFTVLGVACLAMAGCRTDPSIAILTRENRVLEDEVYRLRGIIEDYQTAMQSCDSRTVDSPEPPQPSPPAGPAPATEAPAWMSPVVEEPRQEVAPGEALEQLRTPADRRQQGPLLPNGNPPADAPQSSATGYATPIRPADGGQVARLVLNRQLTGGYDADGVSGDEGVQVVIEPLDDQGRRIAAGADVSVVVLDPALEGEAARVARWDFTAAETAGLFRHTGLGRGIQLNAVWPAAPPVHNQLHLFVRYTTGDGRRLLADGPIRVNLPGRQASGWVPAKHASAPLQAGRPTPVVRPGDSASRQTATRPAEPSVRRPVWSPDRQ